MSSEVRVRFAPSPTGYLHVGGARTAFYNWLFARHMGGKFILRIEDTDQARSTEEALQMQVGDLKWLGLNWDEGPGIGGPYGPYKQSERKAIYQERAQWLLQSGKAYYCFCKDEDLETKRQKALAEGRTIHYDGTCRGVSLELAQKRLASGERGVVRFKIENPRDITFKDIIRGEVTFPASMIGDFVLLRSDGMPVYNYCCVVDDALMKITHVLRAEEHLNNTMRQILLYEAFGYTIPQFGHLSIILGPDRQKLSKRHGATSCNEYHKLGYLPEALLNFIALLGWSSPNQDQEVMSVTEMIKYFSLDRFTPSAAVFDDVKFKWMNATHLRALPHAELWNHVKPFLKEAGMEFVEDPDWIDRALSLFKVSMETLLDAVELFRPLNDGAYAVQPEGVETLGWTTSPAVVRTWLSLLEAKTGAFLTEAEFLEIQEKTAVGAGVKGKNLMMPIRVAVIGRPQGKELKQLVPLIPRVSLIRRAGQCVALLK